MGAHGSATRGAELPLHSGHCQAEACRSSAARRTCCRRRRDAQAAAPVSRGEPLVVKCQAPPPCAIQKATEREFARRYRLGAQVMESGHEGMAVRFATRLSDGLEVVVKSLSRSASFRRRCEEIDWRRTMEAQMQLPKASTLCDIMEVVETRDSYYVVMEKIRGQDLLETALQETLNSRDARDVMRQVLQGLALLHGAGRIHKDLKMENVMVSPSSGSRAVQAKIIDFDTVQDWRPFDPRARTVIGTDGYIAPEAYRGEYSPASDMYAAGVMMYALLTKHFPYSKDLFDDEPGENYVGSPAMERIRDRLERHQVDFEEGELGACPEAAALCKALLAFDAGSRPSAERALAHEWFESLRDPADVDEHGAPAHDMHKKPLYNEMPEMGHTVICLF